MSDWEDWGEYEEPSGVVDDGTRTGMYINDKLVSTIQMDGKSVTKITDEDGKVLWEYFNDYFYVQNDYILMNTLQITKVGNPAATDLQYKVNNGKWFDVPFTNDGTYQIAMGFRGTKVYFRSTTGFSSSSSDYFRINCSQSFSVGGNILSLVNYKTATKATEIPDYSFRYLFINSATINKATFNIGKAKEIGRQCFEYCFYNCTTLTTVDIDFSNITDIATASVFGSCFRGCTKLTAVPNFTNLKTIEGGGVFDSCFYGCSSLMTAPNFSNLTTINSGFRQCFYGCTSLRTTPDFRNVTSVNSGFYQCFYNCTNLVTAYAPSVEIWNTSTFSSWLSGVAATGTLHRSSVSLVIPENTSSGCPTGWTLEPAEKTTVEIHIQDMQDAGSTVTLNEVTKIANSVEALAFENVDTSVSNTLYINRPYKGFTTLYLDGSPLREEDTEREITYSIPANTKGEILVLFDSFT